MIWVLHQALSVSLLATLAGNLSELETRLATAQELLKRVEEGQAPCYSHECQYQKNQLLNEAFRRSTLLPSDGLKILTYRDQAMEGAYQMVGKPFQRPGDEFPKTLKEWSRWWKLRMSHEHIYRGQWLAFVNQAFSTHSALDLILKKASASPSQIPLIEEAWSRGAGQIFTLMREHASLMRQAAVLRDLGKIKQAESLSVQATRLREQRESLENEFGGVFRSVMEKLFPGLSFEKIGNAFFYLNVIVEFERETQIFSPRTLSRLQFWRAELKRLLKSLQNYNDLEYGIVGLNNFNTTTNPAVSIEMELPIQKFLDTFDQTARMGTQIGAAYLMSSAYSLAGLGYLAQSLTFTGLNLTANEYDFDFTLLLWEPATRTQALEALLPELKDQMNSRFKDLLRARKELKRLIQDLETQIQSLKGGPRP